MNPKQFLQIGGIVLVLVALLGFFGITGPTESDSIFGATWYFDNAENWAHLVLGVVALALGFGSKNMMIQKNITILVGVLGLLFAVYNIFSTTFMAANLESPADLILHLGVGLWALFAGMRKQMGGGMAQSM